LIGFEKSDWLAKIAARILILGIMFFPIQTPIRPYVSATQSPIGISAELYPAQFQTPHPFAGYFRSAHETITLQLPWLSVTVEDKTGPLHLLPDSEVIYSPTAIGFNTLDFIQKAGGYLSSHEEYLHSTGWTSAAEIIERVALENSVNPRLLVALLEYRCGCVYSSLPSKFNSDYLMGVEEPMRKGLYHQLGWVANEISIGYYGWLRESSLEIVFPDGETIRLDPRTNAGSAGLAYLLSRWFDRAGWQHAVNLEHGFLTIYVSMFGDPWALNMADESRGQGDLHQPYMILPFQPGKIWAFTSGPHKAWETEGALAALDFAPKSEKEGCTISNEWVVAVGNGVVARSENGAVVLDLDGDGYEQTGWAILYMHVATQDRVALGKYLHTGDPIGHPSCEGARASGTHIHVARKYNGEWIDAGGDCPFVLDGWMTHAGEAPYSGTLTKNGRVVEANLYTPRQSLISRPSVEEIPSLLKFQRIPQED
jgi:LasA protease